MSERAPSDDEQQRGGSTWWATEELTAFDLWNTVVRRRWVVLGVTAAVVLLSVVYVLNSSSLYRYEQRLAVGHGVGAGAQKTAADLNERYLPAAVQSWAEKHPDVTWHPRPRALARSKAMVVVIEGSAPVAREEGIPTILAEAAAALRADHRNRLQERREQVGRRIGERRDALEVAQANVERIETGLERLDGHEKRLRQDIALLEEQLAAARERRQAASRGGDIDAIRLTIFTSDVEDLRRRLAERRRELQFGLPDRRDQYRRQLDESERALVSREKDLREVEAELDRLKPTELVMDPRRSMKRSKPALTLLALTALVLGGVLGVFAAFFAEFVSVARRWRQRKETNGRA